MKLEKIEEWLKKISSENFFGEELSEEEIDLSLDSRDSDPFDSEWVNADKTLEKALTSTHEKLEIQATQDKFRKLIFKLVLHETGSADLAGYVSDDFELIIGTLSCNLNSPFVFSLINSYIQKNIPSNLMPRTTTNPLTH